ncbi:hypothetical protein BC826DRAFT_454230 [Russula brevipes]|nr:hypothetical protein BC826DRAFT_454230 [Russula brevipes]
MLSSPLRHCYRGTRFSFLLYMRTGLCLALDGTARVALDHHRGPYLELPFYSSLTSYGGRALIQPVSTRALPVLPSAMLLRFTNGSWKTTLSFINANTSEDSEDIAQTSKPGVA